jgi:hypothetical protein
MAVSPSHAGTATWGKNRAEARFSVSWAKPSSLPRQPTRNKQAVSKDAIPRPRPRAALNLHNLGDKDASAYGQDRSRAASGFRREPYFDRHVANGAPLDLRELILASVLRSSARPRLYRLRRKPRFQCQASSRPDLRWAAGNFTEGIWRRSWASRPRCLVPQAKPDGCAARRLHTRPGTQQTSDHRPEGCGVDVGSSLSASTLADRIAILMLSVQA